MALLFCLWNLDFWCRKFSGSNVKYFFEFLFHMSMYKGDSRFSDEKLFWLLAAKIILIGRRISPRQAFRSPF